MDILLTLAISGGFSGRDLDRADILLRSLEAFWDFRQPLKLSVVTRPQDFFEVQEKLRSNYIAINVIDETSLVPALSANTDAPGPRRQQTIKLNAYKLLASEYFLIVDADMICTKPLSKNDLFPDGKALTDWEARAAHPNWWDGAAAVLGVQVNHEMPGMSVTPEIFSSEICQTLSQALEKRSGIASSEYLLKTPGWTEYSLYNFSSVPTLKWKTGLSP